MTASTLSTAELIAIAAKCQADAMSASVAELLPRLAERLRSTDARADAAERMLAGVMETLGSEPDPLRLFGIVYHKTPGLREWWEPRCEERFRESRLADLTARRDRERAALEATERELASLTPTSSAAPSPAAS